MISVQADHWKCEPATYRSAQSLELTKAMNKGSQKIKIKLAGKIVVTSWGCFAWKGETFIKPQEEIL